MTYLKKHKMKIRILLLTMLPVICLAQVNPNGEKPAGELLSKEISPNEMKRNASFNVEEIKVRWKKAALENCAGVPCAPSFTCGTSTISDIDGNIYETVSIGTQCWTKTNLRVRKYTDGTDIPFNTSGTTIGSLPGQTWSALTSGAHTLYAHDSTSNPSNLTSYGYLYNWYAVDDSRKLCPTGWHVPTNSEWNKLVKFIDSNADTTSNVQTVFGGVALKKNDALWTTNTGNTNSSGFSALPGGFRDDYGYFTYIGNVASFWSAGESDSNTWTRFVNNGPYGYTGRSSYNKSVGASVRCLKD
jgi:uncharacterized protein (TIGR02145 family)